MQVAWVASTSIRCYSWRLRQATKPVPIKPSQNRSPGAGHSMTRIRPEGTNSAIEVATAGDRIKGFGSEGVERKIEYRVGQARTICKSVIKRLIQIEML